jgi:hypothetical protein
MKKVIDFISVLFFPVVIIVNVGIIGFVLACVTDIKFHTITEHPLPWFASIILTIIAYVRVSVGD